MAYTFLNATNALVWRIVHRKNIPLLIQQGLRCANQCEPDTAYHTIGNQTIINKRNNVTVSVGSGGTLNDYIPFYFTPFSPMMYNIHTGYGGLTKIANEDIVILVGCLHDFKSSGIDFVFTDAHAYMAYTNFYTNLKDLKHINWQILQQRDFQRRTKDSYQAEALIYRYVSLNSLTAVLCYNKSVKSEIENQFNRANIHVPVHARPNRYF